VSVAEEAPRVSTLASLRRELLVFCGFVALTVVMTWPWATHIKDAAPDPGDPFLVSWILAWDFHQTFHDPLHLFNGNIFYPYAYSLAFSEHVYGIALLFFPLFALGAAPLTVHSVATLLAFAFSGYGAYRLTRTLTGSSGAGWIAGIAFAFMPFRVHHMSHLPYLFAGWIPIVLEAVVLYLRKPGRRTAIWLGAAFLMHGLTCIHWLVLSFVPLAASFAFLFFRYGRLRERGVLRNAAVAIGAAGLLLVPFLLPYQRAAKLHGFVRSAGEALDNSARLINWITVEPTNLLWHGLGIDPAPGELSLFPGLALLLLPLAALFLADPRGMRRSDVEAAPRRAILPWLDGVAVIAATIAFFAATPKGIRIAIDGRMLLKATDPDRALFVLCVTLLVRFWIAYPRAFTFLREPSLRLSLTRPARPEAVTVGLVFAVMGFLGSFGMRTPFHRALWDVFFPIRSIRVPARWAMIADLGLALLAGLGAALLADAARRRFPRARWAAPAVLVAIGLGVLYEDRWKWPDWVLMGGGESDPDPLALHLAETPMKGGLVELPANGDLKGNYRYVLRSADHWKPLVNGVSGFVPPIVRKLEELTRARPIADELMDHLESIPTSYVTVHEAWIGAEERAALHVFLARQIDSGRLRFVRRFPEPTRADLYAVAKTEPHVPGARPPWFVTDRAALLGGVEDPSLTGSVDGPAEGQTVNGAFVVRGWGRVPDEDLAVRVLIDGEERPTTISRVPRPDVASVLPQLGDCSKAGYEARIAFAEGDQGWHRFQVIFSATGGRGRLYSTRSFLWEP
jgi:hypothetical protein